MSFLCELAGVATVTSRYLPSVLVASAVVIAGSLIDPDSSPEKMGDIHPPSLIALSGYSPEVTVIHL